LRVVRMGTRPPPFPSILEVKMYEYHAELMRLPIKTFYEEEPTYDSGR